MAILDLYKAGVFRLGINHSFAGRKTANQAAVQHPATTDVIKGITPQQFTLKYEGDAARGFIANKTAADRNSSDFNMLDKTNTKKAFCTLVCIKSTKAIANQKNKLNLVKLVSTIKIANVIYH